MGGDHPTRQRLVDAALRTVWREGIVGTSARAIAREAGVNQALVFYHFGSVDGLLAEASRQVARERAADHASRLAGVESMSALAAIARELHQEERERGNVAMLAQMLAASRSYPAVASTLRENLELLAVPVADAMQRLLAGSPLEGAVPAGHLARSVAAGFIGLELLDDLDDRDDRELFDALDGLATVVDVVIDGGALQGKLLERQIQRRRQGG